MKICDRIQLPDDVTIGYVAGKLVLLCFNEEFNFVIIAHCVCIVQQLANNNHVL